MYIHLARRKAFCRGFSKYLKTMFLGHMKPSKMHYGSLVGTTD